MKLPVRIFSDLHLGHKASRIDDVETLRPLFKGAGTVVFNGDTWEELSGPWREKSAEMLEAMKTILSEEGCETVFLRGNHDPGWEGQAWLELAEGRIVVTHGDALMRSSSPWTREILSGKDEVERIWREFPDAETNIESRHAVAREIALRLRSLHHSKHRSLLSRVYDAAFPPTRALTILGAWLGQGKRGAEYIKRYFPKAEVLVIGHFHCAANRETGGRKVVNTGSFVVPDRAKWAEWDGLFFTAGSVRERQGSCTMSPAETSGKFN